MSIIHVLGNLTRDPELRQAGSSQVCSLRLAENAYVRGEKTTLYFEASVWGRRGETAAEYLAKGSTVLVHGQFSVREYEHNGEQRSSLEIGNAEWQFAGGRNDRQSTDQSAEPTDQSTGSETPSSGDTDLPF
jgi:single-strand DNA-binding protein